MRKNILIIHNNGNGNRKNANCAYGGGERGYVQLLHSMVDVAEVAFAGNDDVVHKFDVENFAALAQS